MPSATCATIRCRWWTPDVRRWFVLAVALAFGTAGYPSSLAADPPRYVGRAESGQRIYGNTLSGWHSTPADPTLDGRPLLAGADPVRWVVDRQRRLPDEPQSYVELLGGDRLPGTILEYVPQGELAANWTPSHFTVRTTAARHLPWQEGAADVRPLERWVQRLVWHRQGRRRHEPATAFLRNGQRLRFRSYRLARDRVHLLLEDEQRIVPFADLAEFHFPSPDPWARYYEMVAVLCSDPSTRCQQLEAVTGLCATVSRERLAVHTVGDRQQPRRLLHGLHPTWSLDLLWVDEVDVRAWRLWQPHQVPLSRFEPVRKDRPQNSRDLYWPWQRDRTVKGALLSSRANGYGWGFGTSGVHQLRFAAPAAAVGFRSEVELDHPRIPTKVESGISLDERSRWPAVGSEPKPAFGPPSDGLAGPGGGNAGTQPLVAAGGRSERHFGSTGNRQLDPLGRSAADPGSHPATQSTRARCGAVSW